MVKGQMAKLKTTSTLSLLAMVLMLPPLAVWQLGVEPLGPLTMHIVVAVGVTAFVGVLVHGGLMGADGKHVTKGKLVGIYLVWPFMVAVPGVGLVGEDLGPVLEGSVRGDHGGAPMVVALADDLEGELGLRWGHVEDGEVVDDEEVGAGVGAQLAFEGAVGSAPCTC